VTQLAFVSDADVVTSGKDGRLVRWSIAGEPRELHRFERPIETFRVVRGDTIVAATHDGALWLIDHGRPPRALRTGGAQVTRMLVLPGDAGLWIAYASGDSEILDTRSWRATALPRAADAIRDIAAAADGRMLAMAVNDNTIHLGVGRTPAEMTWKRFAARVRRVAFTQDGLLVSICTDGTVWLYSPARRTWVCVPTGTAELTQMVFDDTETTLFMFDVSGHLLSLDLAAARRALEV